MKIVQTACACCGQDIEGNSREGWHDRGGNRACAPFQARDGEMVRPTGTHSPTLSPRAMLRPGCQIEVSAPTRRRRGGTYRLGYRWVQGWQVRDPATGRYSIEMRYRDALTHAAEMLASGVAR